MPPHPPTIKIEAIQSNGISPHDKGHTARYHHYHLEFQKYFLVKNLKVLLEKQVPEFPHMRQRMILNGKILEDDKELSEYGITAAAAHNLTIKLFLVDDFSPQPIKIEGPRKDSSGRRTWQPVVNPTGATGHDFSTTVGTFIP